MSLNSYITLGHSGLRVSPFCLGGMTFGNDGGWGSSVADSEAIIARYLADGGNFIPGFPSHAVRPSADRHPTCKVYTMLTNMKDVH